MNDISYKLAFIFAALLHVFIGIFLLIKFNTSSQNFVFQNTNVINATLVSKNKLDQQISSPKQVEQVKPPELPVEISPGQPKEQLKTQPVLTKTIPTKLDVANKFKENAKKKLELLEAKELQELKKAIRTKKQNTVLQKQQLMQQLLSKQLSEEQKELSEAHGQLTKGIVDPYKAAIIQAIAAQWIIPDGVDKNATCQLLVKVGPGGVVLSVKLLSSSGNVLLDRSAQTAVLKASPLPVPSDSVIFDDFRELRLTVRPEGFVGMQ
jgi:colicin import membrane protein